MATAKLKKFIVNVRFTDVEYSVDVKAATLEEALAIGRALKIQDILQGELADWNNREVRAVWENE